jgi:SAM-dependent methyltransferase
MRSDLAQRWMADGRMVSTEIKDGSSETPVTLEHEPVFFPSYPWEWAPRQWISAAALTLDLCEDAVTAGFILKDATPLNILFSGTRATLVDVLSVKTRDTHNPLWIAHGQFVRTFLLPLAAYRHLGWPLWSTQNRRDGYEPGDLVRWLPMLGRWRQPLRSLVTIPHLLEKSANGFRVNEVSAEASSFALKRLLRSARGKLNALVPTARRSRWSDYTKTARHYDDADHDAKKSFVRTALERIQAAHVLDVGANTGLYSRIAAESGAAVVAWDTDVQATDLNWQSAHDKKLPILPIVADFARPTPAVGWQNRENAGLLERSQGKFDCVMMLGVLHHLLITDQIPLPAILRQALQISKKWALLEWVPQGDSQFDGLCRGREALYSHLTEEYFADSLARFGRVVNRQNLPNGRSLWLLEKTA